MLRNTPALLYRGEDVIIADPCYIVKKEDWPKFCDFLEQRGLYDGNNHGVPFGAIESAGLKSLGFDHVLCVSTATGDGHCDIIDHHGNYLGRFGVDAGLIAVFTVKEIKEYNPELDIKSLPRHNTAAIIRNFEGTIRIAEVNEDEGDGTLATLVAVIGAGKGYNNPNFRSDGI